MGIPSSDPVVHARLHSNLDSLLFTRTERAYIHAWKLLGVQTRTSNLTAIAPHQIRSVYQADLVFSEYEEEVLKILTFKKWSKKTYEDSELQVSERLIKEVNGDRTFLKRMWERMYYLQRILRKNLQNYHFFLLGNNLIYPADSCPMRKEAVEGDSFYGHVYQDCSLTKLIWNSVASRELQLKQLIRPPSLDAEYLKIIDAYIYLHGKIVQRVRQLQGAIP